jgi:hypothetical protein
MGKPDFEIAYENIPVLAVCFTRTENPICNAIRFFRGGKKAVDDLAFPNHCFPVSESWGQKYACEETIKGLVENSMEKYRYKKERIVACYYWTGWNDKEVREMALERLAYIRRKQGDKTTKLGKYNPLGLGRFYLLLVNGRSLTRTQKLTGVQRTQLQSTCFVEQTL